MGMLGGMFPGGEPPPFAQSMFPSAEKPKAKHKDEPSTRWEKACSTLMNTAKTVAKNDDDGIDVYCFPGAEEDVDKYMGVAKAESIARIIGRKEPAGECNMDAALSAALDDAFEAGFDKPCTILVLTAGLPSDKDACIEHLREKFAALESPDNLSITFVQVGDSKKAGRFLTMLDEGLEAVGADGEPIDIVDTIKDEEIHKAVDEMQEPSFMESGGKGALLGAFGGMVLGAGAYYMYNKYQAHKRTEGWNGQWEVIKGNEPTGVILTVTDDQEGNLTIEGYPVEEDTAGVPSTEGSYEEDDETYNIVRKGEDGSWIAGNILDEHEIEWKDDTIWREVPPEGVSWGGLALAAGAGAAAGGAVGYLTHKKFFSKSTNGEAANYKLILDCSEDMLEED